MPCAVPHAQPRANAHTHSICEWYPSGAYAYGCRDVLMQAPLRLGVQLLTCSVYVAYGMQGRVNRVWEEPRRSSVEPRFKLFLSLWNWGNQTLFTHP